MVPLPEQKEQLIVGDDTFAGGCDNNNNNNPWPLHYACRMGNLNQVQYLVNVLKFPVNEHDTHDATPLYLAALTGHTSICQFLLEHGAKCVYGGDAARLFYVALTPELRHMLRQWSITRGAASHDVFMQNLKKSFNDPTHADCFVTICGERIFLHRIMLHMTCPQLLLTTTANTVQLRAHTQQQQQHDDGNDDDHDNELVLPKEHDNEIMRHVLEYLYTGIFETTSLEMAHLAKDIACHYGIHVLVGRFEAAMDRHLLFQGNRPLLFQCHICEVDTIKETMRTLGHLVSTTTTTSPPPPRQQQQQQQQGILQLCRSSSDATVSCADSIWHVHSFLLCKESEYLQRAFLGDFKEAKESWLDWTDFCSPHVCQLAIQWFYTDTFLEESSSSVCLQVALEVIEFGFAILCPRLSHYAVNTFLIPAVDTDNVFDMLNLAKLHGLDRLERLCVEMIGTNLESLVVVHRRPEFQQLLREEVTETIQGGDVRVADVPIAADIRRVINQKSQEKRNEKLQLLQQAIESALKEL
jgi:Ankyrin repeats (3 copies)/BTB/POZ domain